MDGYYTDFGYVGFIRDEKMIFSTEAEYEEYFENLKEDDGNVRVKRFDGVTSDTLSI